MIFFLSFFLSFADVCTSRSVGYSITEAIRTTTTDTTWVNNGLDDLTKALILHPIATVSATPFFAFLLGECI